MKKTVLFVAAAVLATATFAQDGLTSKKGFKYLPEAGDWALGTDADPFIKFGQNILNFANNTGVQTNGFNSTGTADYVSGFDNTIVGKYYLTESKAVRVAFHINTERAVTTTFGDNPLTPSAVPNSDVIELERAATGNYDWFVSAGHEFRRGHNRLQGFYGYEVALGFSNDSKVTNTYGVDYNQIAADSGYVASGDSRVLESKSALNVRLGIRGFVGVEYFFIPKMSLAAEFGWGFAYTKDIGRGRTVTEHWGIETNSGATEDSAYTTDVEGGSSERTTGFQVDQGTGSLLNQTATNIRLFFHF